MASEVLVHAQQSNTLTISQNWNAFEVHAFHITWMNIIMTCVRHGNNANAMLVSRSPLCKYCYRTKHLKKRLCINESNWLPINSLLMNYIWTFYISLFNFPNRLVNTTSLIFGNTESYFILIKNKRWFVASPSSKPCGTTIC